MKNITTPRTLADAEFRSGYPVAQPPRFDWLDVMAAVLCGVLLGSVLMWRAR